MNAAELGAGPRCPSCSATAWEGEHRAYVERLRDGRVVVDAERTWHAGRGWRCSYCDAPATQPSLLATVDALVAARFAALALADQALSEHRVALIRRLRAAFLAGAERQWRQAFGRGLTDDELRRVMQEYPGDLPTEV